MTARDPAPPASGRRAAGGSGTGTSGADGPVALVTGAGRGLGRLVAGALVRSGARVLTCSTRATPPGVGERWHAAVDVTDPSAAGRLVREATDRFHRLDVLVNNAGYANAPALLPETPEAIAQRCFSTNALAPMALMARAIPVMLAQPAGGVIVNVASRAGVVPVPRLAAYSASKSALVSLTLAVAKEYPDSRLVCVCVCPGGMDTEMREAVFGAEDARGQQPPERVADVILEIATRRSVGGRSVPSGAAIVVAKGEDPQVIDWPADARGHRRFTLG